jgi:hypothetical protein
MIIHLYIIILTSGEHNNCEYKMTAYDLNSMPCPPLTEILLRSMRRMTLLLSGELHILHTTALV